jgi:hypothetical protein
VLRVFSQGAPIRLEIHSLISAWANRQSVISSELLQANALMTITLVWYLDLPVVVDSFDAIE